MGNPTVGILETSTGLLIEHCNPSFIWSDDSTYILVPQYSFSRIWGYGKQRLLVIDVKQNTKWQSPRLAHYIQPESFEHGDISFVMNPFNNPITRNYSIDTIKQTFEALPALPDKRLPSDPAKPGR